MELDVNSIGLLLKSMPESKCVEEWRYPNHSLVTFNNIDSIFAKKGEIFVVFG
jgi:hypothetical protein